MARAPTLTRAPTQVSAIYDPRGRSLCPRCWSRPAIGRNTAPTRRDVLIGRDLVSVYVTDYPCANDACATLITVPSPFAAELAQYRTENGITAAGLPTFTAGTLGKDGVWRDPSGTPRVTPRPPVQWTARRDGPWVYITAPDLAPAFPKAWTLVDGAVKTRYATALGRSVLAWFAERDVVIEPGHLPDPRYVAPKVTKKQEAEVARRARKRAREERAKAAETARAEREAARLAKVKAKEKAERAKARVAKAKAQGKGRGKVAAPTQRARAVAKPKTPPVEAGTKGKGKRTSTAATAAPAERPRRWTGTQLTMFEGGP